MEIDVNDLRIFAEDWAVKEIDRLTAANKALEGALVECIETLDACASIPLGNAAVTLMLRASSKGAKDTLALNQEKGK